ncbi:thiamine diphosphokinase [Primorskyibacter flagellatus]|uniref:thiamine diphosphokinase n=1 Tax=Primorskyibacter flagellatus TaxID=1387277 RepID=UPI003A8EA043
MNNKILHSAEPVTLVGGGDHDEIALSECLRHAPKVVAADSGADVALSCDILPHAVIGDFDSLSDAAKATIPPERLHHVSEQDSTDFEKCLRSIEAPAVLCAGFLGARLDHQVAVLSVLARYDGRCLLVGAVDIVFAAPRHIALDLPLGSRFSLFPMGAVTGRSSGLRWPIDGLDFAPDGRIGTSNEVTGPVDLETDGAGMLVILPRSGFAQVLEAWGVIG